ncbi:MAG: PrsW family intramembrane metalloprotease [Oscillospiraceae bacterium]|nr:PrsW family intramembrane metalloprotease [Oscillospiraceae bacterium]
MDNLSYIAYICIVVSLGLLVPLLDRKMLRVVVFIIVGASSCLIVSELNNILLHLYDDDLYYVTTTITPITEEIIKAVPILYYAIVFSDDPKQITACSFAVGVGFAMLENIIILIQDIDSVTIMWAVIRGFGSGLVHGICTMMIGMGISFVKKRKKLFISGVFSLLSYAIIFHATYNLLVQSEYRYFGIAMPLLNYIPFLIVNRKDVSKFFDKFRARSAEKEEVSE